MMAQVEQHSGPDMPEGPIGGPAAWRGPDLAARNDWIELLDTGEIAEIDAAVAAHVHYCRGGTTGQLCYLPFREMASGRLLPERPDGIFEFC